MSKSWQIPHTQHLALAQRHFPGLDAIFALQGERITKSPISDLIKIKIANTNYYVKRYYKGGKGLRHYLGRSRAQGEWDNLLLFEKLGIPTPCLVAFGEENRGKNNYRAALITAEVENTLDLLHIAKQNHDLWQQNKWRQHVIKQVANYTHRLHQHGFVHDDLKWRNILVSLTQKPEVYFIDCPLGKKSHGIIKYRGQIKDLLSLDKHARLYLSRIQRLNFYLQYRNTEHLADSDKLLIANIFKLAQAKGMK